MSDRMGPALSEPIFGRVTIIGLGLIGSSIARAARRMNAAGEIVAVGTPEQVAANPKSWTGHYLKELLDRHTRRCAARRALLEA